MGFQVAMLLHDGAYDIHLPVSTALDYIQKRFRGKGQGPLRQLFEISQKGFKGKRTPPFPISRQSVQRYLLNKRGKLNAKACRVFRNTLIEMNGKIIVRNPLREGEPLRWSLTIFRSTWRIFALRHVATDMPYDSTVDWLAILGYATIDELRKVTIQCNGYFDKQESEFIWLTHPPFH